MIKTAEFVSPGHPDKVCDFIADSILDAYLEKDKNTRAGIEVMGGHNLITINGEVRSSYLPDIKSVIRKIVGEKCQIKLNLTKQSVEIAQGVDMGGAGDQGIMKGYATRETENFMPLEYELARNLCRKVYQQYPYDGKTQVTLDGNKIKTIVVSFQNTKNEELLFLVKDFFLKSKLKSLLSDDVQYLINPAGEWTIGSADAKGMYNFEADTGLSGRKLVIDNYGPEISIGGGSFSGKDYTKVDRSGAYIARKIAIDLLRKYNAKEVYTKLAYAIGKREPVMAVAIVDGKEIKIEGYDLSPKGIKKMLKLEKVKFAETAKWGHFGNPNFPWEQ